uniref:RNA cytidine acetyltransferase n=1 Tax=Macrostomum lignano TaxID=282301 RepID=A0A1I8J7S6_9PLAT
TKWKKLDPRLKAIIENGIRDHHRSMFVIVGDKGRDQVPILHHLLSKAVVKARLRKKQKSGKLDVNEDNPFELFVCATEIRWCYYSETHKILGNTFGACVLQDFEALTPNTLARTIETVEGGGLVVLLLHSMDSLRQLATMSMDVHARYRTESHQDVVGRFNERFLLSLANCRRCLVLDDKFNVLPLSESTLATIKPTSTVANLDGLSASGRQLKELQESMLTDPESDQRFARLVGLCRTLDQARALLAFLDLLSDYNKSNAQQQQQMRVAALTASRGRGKSAALGLAIAAAVGKGVANVCVTSPGPENIATLMQFAVKGLQAMGWEQHTDFTIVESSDPDSAKCIVKICLRVQQHRYTIAYLAPSANSKPDSAELLCIDEAAAIPLATVRAMMGSNLCFLSSTVNGYEGTGRSLSLKLISQLRQDASSQLKEITLDESIRQAHPEPQQGTDPFFEASPWTLQRAGQRCSRHASHVKRVSQVQPTSGRVSHPGERDSGQDSRPDEPTGPPEPTGNQDLPPLLSALTERRPEPLHYLAVSFGLTHDLTRFWKRAGFAPLYLRQTPNAITGEHSAVLLRHLATNDAPHPDWLLDYFVDFRRRLIYLLAGDSLRRLPVAFALELVRHRQLQARRPPVLNSARVEQSFSAYDLRRLSDYAAAQADHYLITDLLCPLARLYFAGDLGEMGGLTVTQQAILLGCGLQMKSADSVAADLSMPVSQ